MAYWTLTAESWTIFTGRVDQLRRSRGPFQTVYAIIQMTSPDYAENTTKNKVKEVYLKSIAQLAPNHISNSPKAEAILLQSTYSHESFRSPGSIRMTSRRHPMANIRMAALLIWDALYFSLDSFQGKTQDELDKIVSDLISGKKYIDTNNCVTDTPKKAFMDFLVYANGHLKVAFNQTCLSIANGEVLPMAIKSKKKKK